MSGMISHDDKRNKSAHWLIPIRMGHSHHGYVVHITMFSLCLLVLLVQSSSGFSEKMSMDYCDQIMYPEYPVNCSPMTSTPLITRTTQIPSAACSAPPPPLAPTSCSSSSTSCCSINVPQKLLQLGTTHQPTTITITTPSSRYPQSVKEQEPDEPLATLLTNKETQTECYRDQEMESLKSR